MTALLFDLLATLGPLASYAAWAISTVVIAWLMVKALAVMDWILGL